MVSWIPAKEYITKAQFMALTTLSISDDDVPALDSDGGGPEQWSVYDVWVDMVNGVLGRFVFEEDAPGFWSAIKIAAVAMIEQLYGESREDVVITANRPFLSEKFGSYSYTSQGDTIATVTRQQREGIFTTLPPKAAFIIRLFLKQSVGLRTTEVFKQLPPNEAGISEWHIYLDSQLEALGDGVYTLP